MKADLNKIVPFLGGKSEPGIVRRVSEYGKLKKKLESSERQSWYFKQSKELKRRQLKSMHEAFEEIRKDFNASSLDDLISQLNENFDRKKNLEKKRLNTVKQIAYFKTLSDIEYIKEFIALKKNTAKLQAIDYYAENFAELLDIVG